MKKTFTSILFLIDLLAPSVILSFDIVFEKFIYGNPSQYRINMIFLIFYEELLKKELIFKYK